VDAGPGHRHGEGHRTPLQVRRPVWVGRAAQPCVGPLADPTGSTGNLSASTRWSKAPTSTGFGVLATATSPRGPWSVRYSGGVPSSDQVKQPDQTISGRAVGGMGAGSRVSPVRKRSTAAAAARPSAMAQTISDWPRPASPATKTPGTVDW
jgi:hypothetical protein